MNQVAPIQGHIDAREKSLVAKFADKFSVDGSTMIDTLKRTVFQQSNGQDISNEQMTMLLVVADQYGLNPFTREIYAFPDKGRIVPVVGVDGWSNIINSHPQFDGMEFRQSENMVTLQAAQECPEWMECIIYRKDRSKPMVIREYIDEVYRAPFKPNMKGPWQTHTKRFFRHKTMIQAARIAFSFSGIYDHDEAEQIIEKDITPTQKAEEIRTVEYYSDESFQANKGKWKDMIDAGKQEPERLIMMLESKGQILTDEQKAHIREMGK